MRENMPPVQQEPAPTPKSRKPKKRSKQELAKKIGDAPEQVTMASRVVWVAAAFAALHQVGNFLASVITPYAFQEAIRDYYGDNLESEAAKIDLPVESFLNATTIVGLGFFLVVGLLFCLIYALAGRGLRKGSNWARLFVMFGAFWLGISMLFSFLRSPESVFAQGPMALELIDGIATICAGVAAITAQVLLSLKQSVEFFIKAYEAKHGPIEHLKKD